MGPPVAKIGGRVKFAHAIGMDSADERCYTPPGELAPEINRENTQQKSLWIAAA
jgi:hypothetical protein